MHAIAVDGGITNGSVEVIRNFALITEAPEGALVFLRGDPDDGYGLGAWTITDATGGVVSVTWYDTDGCWYFRMPGTNVTVSAAFGTQHEINGSSGGMMATFCEQVKVRGDRLGGQSRKAALGAEVEALYLCAPGYEIASFSVETDDTILDA